MVFGSSDFPEPRPSIESERDRFSILAIPRRKRACIIASADLLFYCTGRLKPPLCIGKLSAIILAGALDKSSLMKETDLCHYCIEPVHAGKKLPFPPRQTRGNMIPAKPKRKPDIVAKDIGREVVLYSSQQEGIHILNPTARLIWELCDGEHTLGEIEQALRANFSIPSDYSVIEDIQNTLEVFVTKDLLTHPTH
jgi:hypothetical protein